MMQPTNPSVLSLPAADVTISREEGSGGVITKEFAIRIPEVDRNEFLVSVRASSLRRARERLLLMRPLILPWHELALGVCTLALGSFLGALVADIKPVDWQYAFFFSVMPAVGIGAAIVYFFLRRKPASEIGQHIDELLIELPNPDDTI